MLVIWYPEDYDGSLRHDVAFPIKDSRENGQILHRRRARINGQHYKGVSRLGHLTTCYKGVGNQ